MDRLLSDDEIKQALQSYHEYALPTITAENREIAAAQLAKTDREWVEWIEKELAPILYKHCTERICKRYLHTNNCYEWLCPWWRWQERKEEIGL